MSISVLSGLPFKYKIYEIVVSVIFEQVLTQYKLLIP